MDTDNKELEKNTGEATESSVPENRQETGMEKMEIIDYDIDDALRNENEIYENNANGSKDGGEPFNLKKEIISWIKMIVVAVILAVVITNFIIINANVPTSSMENTIPAKSRIMGLRLTYLFSDPERLDVVVFKYQFANLEGVEDMNYVKRIIGLPGETVVIKQGKIEIYKGDELITTLDESGYLKEEWTNENDGYTFVVPEDSYFVLGDNRNHSADTRYWYNKYYKTGKCNYEDLFIDEDDILGKVYFTYWPSFNFVNK